MCVRLPHSEATGLAAIRSPRGMRTRSVAAERPGPYGRNPRAPRRDAWQRFLDVAAMHTAWPLIFLRGPQGARLASARRIGVGLRSVDCTIVRVERRRSRNIVPVTAKPATIGDHTG
jgi:hypothetical protein